MNISISNRFEGVKEYLLTFYGLLSTGDAELSKSWRMKLAVLALKWAQTNMKSFGGDPLRVTIIGESTRASIVGLVVVSKRANGLFHRAICQKGSAFSHFYLINDTFENSKLLAADLRCPIHNNGTGRMMDCLRSQDPNWIVSNSFNTIKELLISRLNFGPVVENRNGLGNGDYAFLEESPEISYAKREVEKVPMIIRVNQGEGAFFAAK